MSNKKFYIVVLVLIIINIFLINGCHDWGDDWALYLNQARALIDGDLKDLQKINTLMMDNGKVGPYLYPMGYPILISPLIFFENNIYLIKLINVIIIFGLFIIVKKISNRFYTINESNVISLIFVSSNFIFLTVNNIGSDLLALFLSLLILSDFLILLESTEKMKVIAIRLLLFSEYLLITRNSYILLIISFLIFIILDSIKNRNLISVYKLFFLILIMLTLNLVVNSFFLIQDGSNEFQSLKAVFQEGEILKVISDNVKYYIELFSFHFLRDTGRLLMVLIIMLYIILKLKGIVKIVTDKNEYNLNRIRVLFFIIFTFTLSIYIIWPYQQGERFVLFNFFILYLIFAKYLVKLELKLRLVLIIPFILVMSIMPIFRAFNFKTFDKKTTLNNVSIPGSENFNNMIKFILSNTQKEDVILCNKLRVLHYYTNRVSYILEENIKKKENKYVLYIPSFENVEYQDLLKREFNLIHQSGELKLYKRN